MSSELLTFLGIALAITLAFIVLTLFIVWLGIYLDKQGIKSSSHSIPTPPTQLPDYDAQEMKQRMRNLEYYAQQDFINKK